MTKIFISYRRDDSEFVTDSIYEQLLRHFDDIFLDVEGIPFGVDFRQHLAEQIAANDVVLAIIGPDWARIMQERAHQPNDFVRIEIETALEQNKLVIPVLVKSATMPNFSDLPASIQPLQWLNSAQIRRRPELVDDCRRLAEGIQQYFDGKPHKDASFTLPQPFEWMNIPTGKVTLEKSPWNGDYIQKDTIFDVPAFHIAKYPITYAQYELFINGGGYQNQSYWTPAGWQLRGNKITPETFSQDKNWYVSEQPVIGVTWYEAHAFTQWLSTQTGNKIALPTDPQWQRAAQGDDGREYPWGNGFDKERCNTSESGIGKATPVLQYPNGASPFEVLDMSGNVWEWCLTDFTTGSSEIDNTNMRVLRGGSWNNRSVSSRVSIRHTDHPDFRYGNIGFRVVRISTS